MGRGACVGFSLLKPGAERTIARGVREQRRWRRSDSGFTLMELMMALLVLTIVLAAMGPAVISLLTATGSTNQRSVANGLAVQATEGIRAAPYSQIGYNTTAPTNCTASNPVILNTATPIVGSTTQTVAGVQYTILTCLYWVNSSAGSTDAQAYKQSIVTVSWTADGISSSVSQTSAIYPGGLGSYTTPENNGTGGSGGSGGGSGTTTTTVANGPAPNPPTNVTAVDDTSAPTNTIDVSWTPSTWSSPSGGYYVVVYTTINNSGYLYTATGGASVTSQSSWSQSTETTASSMEITVGAGTQYYIQVQATDSGDQQVSTVTSNTATATTTSGSGPTCSINTLGVTPSVGTKSGTGVAVDKNGILVNESYFSLSVNANSACSNVTVGYAPSTCTPGANGCTTYYATMTGTGGTLYGTTQSNLDWSDGTQVFTVFTGATPSQYSPLTQAQVQVCTEHGNSGQC